MPKLPLTFESGPEARQPETWGGTSRSDRESFLSSHRLSVRATTHNRSHRWDIVLNGLIGVVLFATVVIGCAVIWPSYLSCRHLQQTTGLIGGQSLATCTIQTSLWWRNTL